MKWEPFFHSETVYDLTLNYCGLENCEPMFVMPPHIREEYLVHYIISGEGIFVTPEKQYNVKSGDIFIIYPGKPVSYRTNPDNPFHFSWFSFTGASSETVVSELGFSHNNCVRHLHSKYSIQDDILECVNILDSKWPPNDFLITSILYRILYKISESYRFDSVNHIGKSKITGEHIMRATAFIKLNYMNPINVGCRSVCWPRAFLFFQGIPCLYWHDRTKISDRSANQSLQRTAGTNIIYHQGDLLVCWD